MEAFQWHRWRRDKRVGWTTWFRGTQVYQMYPQPSNQIGQSVFCKIIIFQTCPVISAGSNCMLIGMWRLIRATYALIQWGGQGVRTNLPWKSQKYKFLAILIQIPSKITKFPIMFLKGYSLEAKTAPKNWNKSVHISWARLASFCHLGVISDHVQ